jgi:hypothetical protein
MNRFYKIALLCGFVPLLVGISIFLLWLVVRWRWLAVAGFFTICGGFLLFLAGVIALACFCWAEFRKPNANRRRLAFAVLGCAGLLLSNFPVAGGIVATVFAIHTRYTVVIKNASELPLENVQIRGGGCDCDLGSIPPEGDANRSFWIQHQDILRFHAICGTTTYSQIIDDFVCLNGGGFATVVVNPDRKTVSILGKFKKSNEPAMGTNK